MCRHKLILVAGYSRGGTNILWNILQSHPEICAPKHETGAIFDYSPHLKFGRFTARMRKFGLSSSFLMKPIFDIQLHRYKMETFKNPNNRYKYENVPYTKKEVSGAALCLKSVDDEIFLTDEILTHYPDLYIICLTRNGYAVANGHKRRERSIEDTAALYNRAGEKMLELVEQNTRVMLVKFEDVIKDPFAVAEELFKFVSVHPVQLPKLRLKSKKVIHHNNEHSMHYGEENQKYWFDKSGIKNFIDPDINKKQIANLSDLEIETFNAIASRQLRSFGYDII